MFKRMLLGIGLLLVMPIAQATDVRLQGLFKHKAVLMIDGQQQVMRAGDISPQGVEVIAVGKETVTLKLGDQRMELGLSQHIASKFSVAAKRQVSIPRGRYGAYFAQGQINGRSIQMMVDTGATKVALSSDDANRLGVSYLEGRQTRVSTASGLSKGYQVMLQRVNVGSVSLNQVPAVVIEGRFPEEVLLGMSFLGRVAMREENNVLYLENK